MTAVNGIMAYTPPLQKTHRSTRSVWIQTQRYPALPGTSVLLWRAILFMSPENQDF